MYARDIFSRPVVTARPEMPLSEAITLLTERGFAALPVVDDTDRVLGILSESDALSTGTALREAAVEAVMTVPVEVVHPDTEVSAIATLMLNHRLRSVPVVEAGILVGIVARRDLLRALVRNDAAVETRIRALLDIYAGSRRQWTVRVTDGRAVVGGGFADAAEQRVVSALALTVDGVDHVEIFADARSPEPGAAPLSEWMRQQSDERIG
ncbi:CBS domain-containing protein [Nocardia pseudobrasiliensis]|uniref:CBS domain protein n=1 Tax=Nocardia pseudobrasiliensis TaxID=45979 RepID=A0A370IC59_9NOCA|nr:CBS domain-containing protein [Nocardia pseudobrasiliensis]RDI68322.1 CBS domain protein [Nocardia pseudobrasiliensis]